MVRRERRKKKIGKKGKKKLVRNGGKSLSGRMEGKRERNGWKVDQVLSRGPNVGFLDSRLIPIASLEMYGKRR